MIKKACLLLSALPPCSDAPRDLARMESLKQQGLAEATIDQFTSGVIDIVTKAAIAAIP